MPVKFIFTEAALPSEELPSTEFDSWGGPAVGPWDFIEQGDKWGYLNHPRWMQESGDPVNYTGNEANEPQAWPTDKHVYSKENINRHMPCGHWHKGRSGGYLELTDPNLPNIYGTYQGNEVNDFVVAAQFNIATETLSYKGYYQTTGGKALQAIDLHNQENAVVVIEDQDADAKLLLVGQLALNGRLPVVDRKDSFSEYDVTENNGATIVHTVRNYYVTTNAHVLLRLGSDLSAQLSGYTGMVVSYDSVLYVLTYIPIIGNPFNFPPPDPGGDTYWTLLPGQVTNSFVYSWPQAFGFAARGVTRTFISGGDLYVSEHASPFDENKVFDSELGVILDEGYRNANNGPTLVVDGDFAYNVDRGISSWTMYQMARNDWAPTGKTIAGAGVPINSGYAMIYNSFYLQTHEGGIYSILVPGFDSLADSYGGADSRQAIIPLKDGYFATSGVDDIYVYHLSLAGIIRLVDSISLSSFGPLGYTCRGLVARIN